MMKYFGLSPDVLAKAKLFFYLSKSRTRGLKKGTWGEIVFFSGYTQIIEPTYVEGNQEWWWW